MLKKSTGHDWKDMLYTHVTNYKPNMHALLPMGINIARSITSHQREIWEF